MYRGIDQSVAKIIYQNEIFPGSNIKLVFFICYRYQNRLTQLSDIVQRKVKLVLIYFHIFQSDFSIRIILLPS